MSGGDKAYDILRDALLAEAEIPVTEAEVEEYMNRSPLPQPEAVDRGRSLFVRKVLIDESRSQDAEIRGDQSFGEWLIETRERARLSRKMVATALGKEESFVERVESGAITLSSLSPGDAADIKILFNLPLNSIRRFLVPTLPGYTIRRRDPPPASFNTRGMIDFNMPREASGGEPSLGDSESKWLNDLADELKRRRTFQ